MSTPGLVLAIFPGIDLFGRAVERATGWTVVRGPDVIWGGDIRTFHPPAGVFDGVLGGDPCQAHSVLAHLVRYNGHEPRFPDMTPEFARVVAEAQPRWFLRENVPGAPDIEVEGYDVWTELVTDSDVGGLQPRTRRIWFGLREGMWDSVRSPFSLLVYAPGSGAGLSVMAGHHGESPPGPAERAERRRARSVVADARNGSTGTRIRGGGGVLPHGETGRSAAGALPIADACEAMGLPRDFMENVPLTVQGKRSVLGNGVTQATGRALARMVQRALEGEER